MDEAYQKGLNMIVKHGASRSLQGLSEVGIFCVGRDIPELRALFCG